MPGEAGHGLAVIAGGEIAGEQQRADAVAVRMERHISDDLPRNKLAGTYQQSAGKIPLQLHTRRGRFNTAPERIMMTVSS
jgi:hypothetical protein